MNHGVEKITEMGIVDALLTSIIGFAIVFFVLIALMSLIGAMRSWMEKVESAKAATAEPVSAAVPAAASGMVPAKGSLGEIKLHGVDDKTAAMLMAIVADESKAPLNELRFISIREKK